MEDGTERRLSVPLGDVESAAIKAIQDELPGLKEGVIARHLIRRALGLTSALGDWEPKNGSDPHKEGK